MIRRPRLVLMWWVLYGDDDAGAAFAGVQGFVSPGMEYDFGRCRAHYEAAGDRMHAESPRGRMHFMFKDEDL